MDGMVGEPDTWPGVLPWHRSPLRFALDTLWKEHSAVQVSVSHVFQRAGLDP